MLVWFYLRPRKEKKKNGGGGRINNNRKEDEVLDLVRSLTCPQVDAETLHTHSHTGVGGLSGYLNVQFNSSCTGEIA